MTGPATDGPTTAWTACHAALGRPSGPGSRDGRSRELFQQAAERWERLQLPTNRRTPASGRPRRCSRSGRRGPGIQPVLRAAYQTTLALGAGPLRREIELLAGRGRLRLEEQAAAAVAPERRAPAASLGLTRREAEMLALVAAGRTNRQIGGELFITEKTASVHVSRILAKLGVAGRGEAAARRGKRP